LRQGAQRDDPSRGCDRRSEQPCRLTRRHAAVVLHPQARRTAVDQAASSNAIVDEPRLGVAERVETRSFNLVPAGETLLSFGEAALIVERLPPKFAVLPECLLLRLPFETALMLDIARLLALEAALTLDIAGLLAFEAALTLHCFRLLAFDPALALDVSGLLAFDPTLALDVARLLALEAAGLLLRPGRPGLMAFGTHLLMLDLRRAELLALRAHLRGREAAAAVATATVAAAAAIAVLLLLLLLLRSGLAALVAAVAAAGLRCSRGRDRQSGDTCGEE
jgi:hypothetical protein